MQRLELKLGTHELNTTIQRLRRARKQLCLVQSRLHDGGQVLKKKKPMSPRISIFKKNSFFCVSRDHAFSGQFFVNIINKKVVRFPHVGARGCKTANWQVFAQAGRRGCTQLRSYTWLGCIFIKAGGMRQTLKEGCYKLWTCEPASFIISGYFRSFFLLPWVQKY